MKKKLIIQSNSSSDTPKDFIVNLCKTFEKLIYKEDSIPNMAISFVRQIQGPGDISESRSQFKVGIEILKIKVNI